MHWPPLVDSEPMYPGFETRESHDFYFFYVLSLVLQYKFANATLVSLLSFSYFITPYDVQASNAFSALISLFMHANKNMVTGHRQEFVYQFSSYSAG